MTTNNANILVFDTSLNKTYIGLSAGGNDSYKIISSDDKNYHSAYLISALKKILEQNNVSLKDLDLIAVNAGPGSFTGIRVGITTAKTLSKELDKKVLGASSFDILYQAYSALNPDIILDARRESFYFKENNEITLVPYSEIKNHIKKDTVICDTSSYSVLMSDNDLKYKNIINFEDDDVNLASALMKIAHSSTQKDLFWYNLKPLYIQAPPIHKKK